MSISRLPNRQQAYELLRSYVSDDYQLLHARMVGACLAQYAVLFSEDPELWYTTGLLHDIDFQTYPDEHPSKSLEWFKEWGYPPELIHAIDAHVYGYNNFTTKPQTRLASALMACDELCGLCYAYKKLNPISYSDMKVSSLKKRLKETSFAAKIDRETIYLGVELLGIPLDDHLKNILLYLSEFE